MIQSSPIPVAVIRTFLSVILIFAPVLAGTITPLTAQYVEGESPVTGYRSQVSGPRDVFIQPDRSRLGLEFSNPLHVTSSFEARDTEGCSFHVIYFDRTISHVSPLLLTQTVSSDF